MSSDFWNRKTFAIVTGASRGIGRTLAEQLARVVAPGSSFLLLSRDRGDLESLRETITASRPEVNVEIGVVDLSSCDESRLEAITSAALTDPASYAHALCIHNAGSLGDASQRCTSLLQVSPIVDYFRLNVASAAVLNALFFRLFSCIATVRKTVVNISSLCGVEAFPSLALYCTGKAAREMFFQVLAKEEPSVRVLSYGPGPVETAMRTQLLEQSWDERVKSGNALTTEMTCTRLLRLLADDRYASGSHVDYFDPLD